MRVVFLTCFQAWAELQPKIGSVKQTQWAWGRTSNFHVAMFMEPLQEWFLDRIEYGSQKNQKWPWIGGILVSFFGKDEWWIA